MMDAFLLGAGTAVWLGILTSISPCPLATNIAAVSFVGRRVGDTWGVLLAGLIYALGRLISYVAIGALVVTGLLSMSGLSMFLQEWMNKAIGPLLIVVGVLLLGVFKFGSGLSVGGERIQRRAEKAGLWGALLLGLVFALSFCPVSAALFFGSLIPLATEHSSRVLYPSLYGIGTALPVIACAVVLAFSAKSVGTFFDRLTRFELWFRRVTGVVFILVGIYQTLTYVFGVYLF